MGFKHEEEDNHPLYCDNGTSIVPNDSSHGVLWEQNNTNFALKMKEIMANGGLISYNHNLHPSDCPTLNDVSLLYLALVQGNVNLSGGADLYRDVVQMQLNNNNLVDNHCNHFGFWKIIIVTISGFEKIIIVTISGFEKLSL